MNYIKRARDFQTKKKLGQNFLINENVIKTIVNLANISKEDTILEIGPGIGFVTEQIANLAKKVIAVEIDDDAITQLNKLGFDNLEIINQDILKTDISQLSNDSLKVIANIPYYITTPILVHLLGEIEQTNYPTRDKIKEIIFMVQYEVAKRITANQNNQNKEYGLTSILANYWCDTEFICKVPAKDFYPAPKVDSAIIKLKFKQTPAVHLNNPKLFKTVINACFNKRRKNIKNALTMSGFDKEIISKALELSGFDETIRGEKLSIKEFKILTDNIESLS